ncbi:MAG: L,D-transpeptidase [Rhizobiaceae bacterium]|nr:L,D-transpeptidase [Rhizobiaceae bacterium]
MIRLLVISVMCSLIAGTGVASAQSLFGSGDGRYREADSYIDQYGREVIFDVQTGQVIAVVPPGERRYLSPAERRAERRRQLGREDRSGRRIPLGERLQRELEVHLGIREPEAGTFDGRERAPAHARPEYPERPQLPREAPRNRVDRMPLGEPEEPAAGRDPDERVAAVPEQESGAGAAPMQPGVDASLLGKGASEDVAKIQILLDRAGMSPGVIDGRMGDNVNKAIKAYKEKTGQALRTYDPASVDETLAATGGDPFITYTITAQDAAGPYVASVPADYGEKARLDSLPYTSVLEMLAERFHMDERYLRALNPGVNFDRPGTIIKVANVGKPISGNVARIVADKAQKQVRVYAAGGRLLAAYPATIGSEGTPSPSGTVSVERIAFDPEYTYNPKINFKQGQNDKVLTIPPGPNGPVGSIWIALSKPTYGIHGTPEPSKIGKTFSHGCVRLTNWDATELAKMVREGVTVEFLE